MIAKTDENLTPSQFSGKMDAQRVRFTDRATQQQITNTMKLFREYLESIPREVFTKHYFLRLGTCQDEWYMAAALQDFQAWTIKRNSGIKRDMSHEEGLLFEHYLLRDMGCNNRYDVEMSNTFARVCRSDDLNKK